MLADAEPAAGAAETPFWVWRTAFALVFIIIGALTIRSLTGSTADPDMFWHIATGRWIVEHRALPATDVFSWYGLEHGSRWLVQEWLSELVFFALHKIGGFALLYAFIALLSATTATLAGALATVRGARPLIGILVALAVGVGLTPFVSARPQMLTFCLLLVMCLCLERGWIWAAVPIVIVGANLHGGMFPVYLVLIAFYVLPEHWPVLAASAAAVLVNPAHVQLLGLPFRTLLYPGGDAVMEFKATALASNRFDLLVYLGVLALLVAARPRLKPRDGLLALAVTALSLTAARNVALFYLLVLPVLAPYLDRERQGSETTVPARLRPQVVLLPPLAALAVAVIVLTAALPALPIDSGYPKDALAFIKSHHVSRVLNVWQDGGYMIYNDVAPFIDGRGDPFVPASTGGPDVYREYAGAFGMKEDWTVLARRYRVGSVLVGKSIPFYRVLQHSTSAEVIYEDKAFALFRVKLR
jgi:hypothetical protein